MSDNLDLGYVQQKLTTKYVGRRLTLFEVTTSTMVEADRLAEQGAPEGVAAIAEEQTAGRGRIQRTWTVPKGSSLLVSVILRPTMVGMQRITIATAIAVARAIERVTNLRVSIKWPNDVLIGDLKVCGILVETHLRGSAVEYAVVGVGINVNFDASAIPEIAGLATSLATEAGAKIRREDLLVAFFEELEKCYEGIARDTDIFDEWRRRLVTLGKKVTATFGKHVEEGVAEDVDEEGALILRREDGTMVLVNAGDVTLRRPPSSA